MTPPLHRLEEALPRFSLDRRISVLVLMAALIVVGIVAAISIPLELIPAGFSAPFLAVRVPWRDAPPKEVLEKIVKPLEDELSTVRGLDTMFSTSRRGLGRVFLNFKNGTNMKLAYRELRDRVERSRSLLPADADRIYIRKDDSSSIPVYVLGISYDPGIGDPYQLLQHHIIMHLERLDGVAAVQSQGLVEKEIFIELDRARTEASGLNIYEISQKLGADNFNMASGDVRWGDRKLLLRSSSRFRSLDDIRNIRLSEKIRVSDIATVSYKAPKEQWRVRANSRPAVALIILKEGQANTIDVARRINEEIEKIGKDPQLKEIGLTPIFDQGQVILESLNTLINSGKIGALFAAIVLFFFLRRLRLTLIISFCIPLSLVAAIVVMYFAGETLNILTLLGLMISVGLLVDNSVVVAENIFRLRANGVGRREAAIQGAGEIALAVTTATLTTVIVFVPVALVKGQAQFFMMRLALPISIALLASLFIAGIFVPLAVYLSIGESSTPRSLVKKSYRRGIDALGVAYELTMEKLNRFYTRFLKMALEHRLDLLLLLLLVSAFSITVAQRKIKVVQTQEEERSGFEISVNLPPGMTLDETGAYFIRCEKTIESLQDQLGLSGWFLFHTADYGKLQGFFNNPRTVKISPRLATQRVRDALPELPGARIYTGQESERENRGEAVAEVILAGDDAEILEESSKKLEPLFLQVPGVLGLKSSGEPEPSEIGLIIDRDRAQQAGVNPRVIAGLVGYALRGQQLARFRSGGEDIPVRVRYREEDRKGLKELESFSVPAADGNFLPLSALTRAERLRGARTISRRNKRSQQSMVFELEEGREDEARHRIRALQDEINLPEGVRFDTTLNNNGRGGPPDEDMASMRFALGLSIVFIYLLMGFLFESAILPLSIISTIPLAGIGVIWAHVIAGYNLDGLGMVGIILLVGVVVNNGIVLIDYANRLRESGLPRREALLLAAQRRFRPIMMTALTTICGMIPVTLSGATSIGLSYTSFGLTLIGGLTTATFLTLLVVPVFYTLFEDLGNLGTSLLYRASRGARAAKEKTA